MDDPDDVVLVLSMALHTADVSNPAKPCVSRARAAARVVCWSPHACPASRVRLARSATCVCACVSPRACAASERSVRRVSRE